MNWATPNVIFLFVFVPVRRQTKCIRRGQRAGARTFLKGVCGRKGRSYLGQPVKPVVSVACWAGWNARGVGKQGPGRGRSRGCTWLTARGPSPPPRLPPRFEVSSHPPPGLSNTRGCHSHPVVPSPFAAGRSMPRLMSCPRPSPVALAFKCTEQMP